MFSPLSPLRCLFPLLEEAVSLSPASKTGKGIIPREIPGPTTACLCHRAGNLLASCSFCSSPETAHGQAMAPAKAREGSEEQQYLHGASGKGIFPRKAAGVCPSPSDIPSKRPL